MMNRLVLWCLLGIGVWFCLANVSAQDAPGLPNSTSSDSRGDAVIRRNPLDIIVLYNPDGGRSITLTGDWPISVLDDFYGSLMKIRQDQVPLFIIRNVTATGTVTDNYVETYVQIELTTSGSQSVRIPLGFKEGILREDQTDVPSFRYTGPGSALLTVDPTVDTQERQFIAIVTPHASHVSEESGNVDSPKQARPEAVSHTLSLLLWFPFTANGGDEKRLSISFPQSNSSQFLLEVPMTNVDAAVTRGFMLAPQEDAARQLTLLRIQGLGTETEITWKTREISIVDDRPGLLVEKASIDVRLDFDTRSATYEAVLPVSSATGSFDQLQIRLPQGSVLDRDMTDRYAVSGNYVIEEVGEGSVATIRFPQKTTGPVSIHLRTVQQFEGNTSIFRRDLEGFEVLGAERQAGTLSVSVLPLELKPHWELGRGIRRSGGGSSSVDSVNSTRFEFNSQPFLLNVRAVESQIQINVKPDYQFLISRGVITMNARLSYTVSGSKAEALYLRLPDSRWHCDFGASSNVDATRVVFEESGLLKIPLRNFTDGSFFIDFRARQTIETEDEQKHRLILPIPRPERVTWSDPATVTVGAVHDVEVVPMDQETRGLTRQSRRMMPPIRIATDLQQEPFFYSAELADTVFVADLMFHQPRINATMQTDVHLFEEHNQVRQTITYNPAFTQVDRVFFLLPRALNASDEVQVQWGNRTLDIRDTTAVSQENVPDNFVRKMVQLPDLVSQFSLTFLYPPPPLVVTDDDTVPFSLSLICPADVPVTDHRIHFFAPPGYRVDLQTESRQHWEPFREPRRPSANITETFRSAQSPTRIALLISASERSISGTTRVERAWLQTWLTGSIRQDWATYLLRSTHDSVTLQLPPDSMRDHKVGVQVNGQQILQPNISPTGILTIPIAPEQYNRPIEVFVDYRYTFQMPDIEVQITLPTFVNDKVQYQFWQVMLQPNRHIIGSPAGWTLKYDWSWNGLFWWRVPSIRKSDIGFEADTPIAEAGISRSSQYVFSHIQPSSRVTLYVVKRSWIILLASSIALCIGLVLIYVPQSRYAGSLFGLGVVLLAVLFYQPPLVLLMLQAASFGIFLALGAGYIYRIFHRQKQWIPPTFQTLDDLSQPYVITSVPASQTIHEVIIDGESGSEERSAINNRNGVPPNGS